MSSLRSRLLVLASLAAATAAPAADFQADQPEAFARLVAPGAKLEKLAGDLGFTEGPVWIAAGGYLVFSDIPGDELKRWSPAGGLASFRRPSRNANGNTVDAAGRLITCEHSGRRVALLEADGTLRTLVDSFEGRKLNSPNDAVVRRDGSIYFTDPDYGLKNKPGTREKEGKEQPGNYVYRHDPKTGRTTALVKDFSHPNGLAFSPDETRLYIADSGAPKHLRVFNVAADGTLTDGKVFYTLDAGVPDGIRVDRDGRIWTTAGDGVHILAPDGRRIGKILVPEAPANLAFGGADGRTLFITARKSLYSIRVEVAGAGR
jgi:gluconolactonase